MQLSWRLTSRWWTWLPMSEGSWVLCVCCCNSQFPWLQTSQSISLAQPDHEISREHKPWKQGQVKDVPSLESLYRSILQAAFFENDVDDNAIVHSVLSVVVLTTNPPSQSTIMGKTSESDVRWGSNFLTLLYRHQSDPSVTKLYPSPTFKLHPHHILKPVYFLTGSKLQL